MVLLFASFHRVICVISRCEISLMTRQFLANYTMMCILACHELMITYEEKRNTNRIETFVLYHNLLSSAKGFHYNLLIF